MKRFEKGQRIFHVHMGRGGFFGPVVRDILPPGYLTWTIFEREVDACGKKQVTFRDRGLDAMLGRSFDVDTWWLQPTIEDARAVLWSRIDAAVANDEWRAARAEQRGELWDSRARENEHRFLGERDDVKENNR